MTRTLAEWVAIYEQRKTSGPGDSTIFTVTYTHPADTGAREHWHVTLEGSPVEEVPDVQGWRIIHAPAPDSGRPGAIGIGEPTRHRDYWLSRTREQRLPD